MFKIKNTNLNDLKICIIGSGDGGLAAATD